MAVLDLREQSETGPGDSSPLVPATVIASQNPGCSPPLGLCTGCSSRLGCLSSAHEQPSPPGGRLTLSHRVSSAPGLTDAWLACFQGALKAELKPPPPSSVVPLVLAWAHGPPRAAFPRGPETWAIPAFGAGCGGWGTPGSSQAAVAQPLSVTCTPSDAV